MAKKPSRSLPDGPQQAERGAHKPSHSLPRGPRQAERDARLRAREAGRHAAAEAGAEEQREPTRQLQRTARRLHVRQERREAIIYASNWRTPLLIDIIGGILIFVAGAVCAVLWSPFVAGAGGALGGLYAVLAVRRWHLWASRRRAAGLPT